MIKKNHRRRVGFLLSAVIFLNSSLLPLAQADFWSERKNQTDLAMAMPAGLSPSALLNKSGALPLPLRGSLQPCLSGEAAFPHSNLPAAFLANVNIREASKGGAPLSVILMEDVHANRDVQHRISSALCALGDSEGDAPVLVALEGAFGKLPFDAYRNVIPAKVGTVVGDSYFDTGDIAGPAHAGLTGYSQRPSRGLSFVGVDDLSLYTQNVSAYTATKDVKIKTQKKLMRAQQALEEKALTQMNGALYRFQKTVSDVRAGRVAFPDYMTVLSQKADTVSLNAELFLSAYRIEKKLDFERIEAERAVVIKKMVAALNEADTQALVDGSVSYQKGDVTFAGYYSALQKMCEKAHVSLKDYAAFDEFVRYALMTDGVKAEALLAEAKSLERKTFALLATTAAEKNLVSALNDMYLMNGLINFSLTTDEWAEYKEKAAAHAMSPLTQSFRASMPPFEKFYEAAEARSVALIQNLDKALSQSKRPQAGMPLSVLVAGGFHTNDLKRLLQKKGLGYAVATPKIAQADASAPSNYLSLFDREKTPLEKIFTGQKLFVAPPAASPNVLSRIAASTAGLMLATVGSLSLAVRRVLQSFGLKGKIIEASEAKAQGQLVVASPNGDMARVQIAPATGADPAPTDRRLGNYIESDKVSPSVLSWVAWLFRSVKWMGVSALLMGLAYWAWHTPVAFSAPLLSATAGLRPLVATIDIGSPLFGAIFHPLFLLNISIVLLMLVQVVEEKRITPDDILREISREIDALPDGPRGGKGIRRTTFISDQKSGNSSTEDYFWFYPNHRGYTFEFDGVEGDRPVLGYVKLIWSESLKRFVPNFFWEHPTLKDDEFLWRRPIEDFFNALTQKYTALESVKINFGGREEGKSEDTVSFANRQKLAPIVLTDPTSREGAPRQVSLYLQAPVQSDSNGSYSVPVWNKTDDRQLATLHLQRHHQAGAFNYPVPSQEGQSSPSVPFDAQRFLVDANFRLTLELEKGVDVAWESPLFQAVVSWLFAESEEKAKASELPPVKFWMAAQDPNNPIVKQASDEEKESLPWESDLEKKSLPPYLPAFAPFENPESALATLRSVLLNNTVEGAVPSGKFSFPSMLNGSRTYYVDQNPDTGAYQVYRDDARTEAIGTFRVEFDASSRGWVVSLEKGTPTNLRDLTVFLMVSFQQSRLANFRRGYSSWAYHMPGLKPVHLLPQAYRFLSSPVLMIGLAYLFFVPSAMAGISPMDLGHKITSAVSFGTVILIFVGIVGMRFHQTFRKTGRFFKTKFGLSSKLEAVFSYLTQLKAAQEKTNTMVLLTPAQETELAGKMARFINAENRTDRTVEEILRLTRPVRYFADDQARALQLTGTLSSFRKLPEGEEKNRALAWLAQYLFFWSQPQDNKGTLHSVPLYTSSENGKSVTIISIGEKSNPYITEKHIDQLIDQLRVSTFKTNHDLILNLNDGVTDVQKANLEQLIDRLAINIEVLDLRTPESLLGLKNNNGLISYTAILEQARKARLARGVTQGFEAVKTLLNSLEASQIEAVSGVVLKTVSRHPELYEMDPRLYNVWTLIVNWGLGWLEMTPRFLSDIDKRHALETTSA